MKFTMNTIKFTMDTMDDTLFGCNVYIRKMNIDVHFHNKYDWNKFVMYINYPLKDTPCNRTRIQRTSNFCCVGVALMFMGSSWNSGCRDIWMKNLPCGILLSEVI